MESKQTKAASRDRGYPALRFEHGVDREAFKQFVVALGIHIAGRELDLGACKDKQVRVALTSRSADDGRVIVNVCGFHKV